ncbi:hypothetical protein WUBG_08404 [Wuchereria bancrofti]|nr:hypothetical protein WUBG_08404 [Wuchereria bancrofti]
MPTTSRVTIKLVGNKNAYLFSPSAGKETNAITVRRRDFIARQSRTEGMVWQDYVVVFVTTVLPPRSNPRMIPDRVQCGGGCPVQEKMHD